MNSITERSAGGMTLVELMVTLALFAFLVLLGVPLTHAWVQSAHQRDAAGMLIEGLGRAKALGLRNPLGLTDQAMPVAVTCLGAGKISVAAATQAGVDCTKAVNWAATLPFDTSIVQSIDNKTPFQCVAYNERGIALATSVNGHNCYQSSLNVLAGNEDAFNVPLP